MLSAADAPATLVPPAPTGKELGDRVEAYAAAARCPRHLPQMRACMWQDNKPCTCRLAVGG